MREQAPTAAPGGAPRWGRGPKPRCSEQARARVWQRPPCADPGSAAPPACRMPSVLLPVPRTLWSPGGHRLDRRSRGGDWRCDRDGGGRPRRLQGGSRMSRSPAHLRRELLLLNFCKFLTRMLYAHRQQSAHVRNMRLYPFPSLKKNNPSRRASTQQPLVTTSPRDSAREPIRRPKPINQIMSRNNHSGRVQLSPLISAYEKLTSL